MLLWNHAGTDPVRAAEALIKLEARVQTNLRPYLRLVALSLTNIESEDSAVNEAAP